jgi:hypothetical protein
MPGAARPAACVIPALISTSVGYGAATTTGGGDAAPVNVSSYAEDQAVLDDYRDAFEEGTRAKGATPR